jgi:hypothetical protein
MLLCLKNCKLMISIQIRKRIGIRGCVESHLMSSDCHRRVQNLRCLSPISRRMPVNALSIDCWRRPTTANAGLVSGSIWRATQTIHRNGKVPRIAAGFIVTGSCGSQRKSAIRSIRQAPAGCRSDPRRCAGRSGRSGVPGVESDVLERAPAGTGCD